MSLPPSFLWIFGRPRIWPLGGRTSRCLGRSLQNPAIRPAQKRHARDHEFAQRAATDSQALDRFPIVRKPIDEEVVRRRAGIHPPHPAQRLKLPDAVHLEHCPGREIRELLVIRRLECERSFTGDERASARDGTAVEIDAQHEQAAATKGGSRNLREIAATALRRSQCAAARPLPAARLDLQELVDPAPDVVLRSYCEVLHMATLAQALLLAAQPPAQVARYRQLRIGFLVVSFIPQAARKNVGYPTHQPNLVYQSDQHPLEQPVL